MNWQTFRSESGLRIMSLDTRPEEVLLAARRTESTHRVFQRFGGVLQPDRTVSHANDGFARVLGCSTNGTSQQYP